MNQQNRNTLTGRENILTVANGREVGRMGEIGEGMKKYKLIVTE